MLLSPGPADVGMKPPVSRPQPTLKLASIVPMASDAMRTASHTGDIRPRSAQVVVLVSERVDSTIKHCADATEFS